MVAAGPALWDVTADPRRPQNSLAKGGPSSTVPGGSAGTETDSRLLAWRDRLSSPAERGEEPRPGPPSWGGARGWGGAPARPCPDASPKRPGTAPRKPPQRREGRSWRGTLLPAGRMPGATLPVTLWHSRGGRGGG